MIKQSFSWWCFNNRGIGDDALLKQAREIGLDAVELIQPELFQLAVDSGLTVATHGGHESISFGLNDLAQHDRIEKEIDTMLVTAKKYGIPSLIVFSGERRPGLTEAEGVENTVKGLSRVVKSAEDAGVTLILELLNSKIDHGGYQADHTSWGVEVCKAVNSSRVKLLYDIYHMQIMEGDLIRTVRDNYQYIGHYHTAGNPGRNDITADTQEISYPPLFKAIKETGYTGYIGHEFIPSGEPLAALKTAYEITRAGLD